MNVIPTEGLPSAKLKGRNLSQQGFGNLAGLLVNTFLVEPVLKRH
jgi:hypothetical protein